MNFYKRHLGDYAKDTGHLTMLEHGAYTLLLDRYYSTEAPIPEADACRVARARSREERAAVESVLREFFTLEDGVWRNKRADAELSRASAQRDTNREVGKRGGRPRKTESVSESKTESVSESKTESVSEKNPSQTPDTRHLNP